MNYTGPTAKHYAIGINAQNFLLFCLIAVISVNGCAERAAIRNAAAERCKCD